MEKKIVGVSNGRSGGPLSCYGHFILDLILPEINEKVYEYDIVCRFKHHTWQYIPPCFQNMYEEIMDVENRQQLSRGAPDHWKKIQPRITTKGYCGALNKKLKKKFEESTNWLIDKYLDTDNKYPEVIFIEREASSSNSNRNGLIYKREKIKKFLNNKIKYETLRLVGMAFKKQLNYFYHAKIIIGLYGSNLTNTVFCKNNVTLFCIKWPDQHKRVIQTNQWKYLQPNINVIWCKNNPKAVISKLKKKLNLQ